MLGVQWWDVLDGIGSTVVVDVHRMRGRHVFNGVWGIDVGHLRRL